MEGIKQKIEFMHRLQKNTEQNIKTNFWVILINFLSFHEFNY